MKRHRPTIGTRIEWEECYDRHRGTCIVRDGLVTDVKGRNVWIDGDAKWLPDLSNWRELPDKHTGASL